jgi:hypothetical protein
MVNVEGKAKLHMWDWGLWYNSSRRAQHSTVSETFKRGEVGYSV